MSGESFTPEIVSYGLRHEGSNAAQWAFNQICANWAE